MPFFAFCALFSLSVFRTFLLSWLVWWLKVAPSLGRGVGEKWLCFPNSVSVGCLRVLIGKAV